jgi:hypothetical protein
MISKARRDTAVPPTCIVMNFCSLTSAACELRCWLFQSGLGNSPIIILLQTGYFRYLATRS